ncbi:hypothetical protein [Syntrophomonas palmitatica]|uniref:hypothetical protein n=1 Tax=Syntrophomonas palmitatica TaxID=402877 RepID=UPI0006D1B649|nr:hypothetical protein [Syntrophomonas palmitatica]
MRFHKVLIVLGIFGLFIAGLNTANQGINCLTLDNRQPVVGLKISNEGIYVIALGQGYEYDQDKLDNLRDKINEKTLRLQHILRSSVSRLQRFLTSYPRAHLEQLNLLP